jgi:hypothetical protein
MPVACRRRRFSRAQSGIGAVLPGGGVVPASPVTCGVTPIGGSGWPPQQLHVHAGQGAPAGHPGQAQPQPPTPEPLPPSTVTTGCIRAHDPVGHGVVKHSMVSAVQPQASAVSATQDLASVYEVHGSGGGVAQSHGAQAVLAGQAGQAQTETAVEPVPVPVVVVVGGVFTTVPLWGTVIVVVAPLLHEQLQAGQAAPAGHSGQLQVQVPVPPPAPVEPPAPVPHPPPAPPVPPPEPHWQSQGGQASPGRHAGQPQVQVPPPPLPASTGAGGGQSH